MNTYERQIVMDIEKVIGELDASEKIRLEVFARRHRKTLRELLTTWAGYDDARRIENEAALLAHAQEVAEIVIHEASDEELSYIGHEAAKVLKPYKTRREIEIDGKRLKLMEKYAEDEREVERLEEDLFIAFTSPERRERYLMKARRWANNPEAEAQSRELAYQFANREKLDAILKYDTETINKRTAALEKQRSHTSGEGRKVQELLEVIAAKDAQIAKLKKQLDEGAAVLAKLTQSGE